MQPPSDILWRGIFAAESVRFSYALVTALANRAVCLHDCDPPAAHLLCRALGAAVLAAPLLNGDEKYTLRWNYRGALQTVVVDVDSRAAVRGFVAPPQLTGLAEGQAGLYGDGGRVTVIKSTAAAKLHSSQCEAQLLDVVEDLVFFFCTSDQVETGMAVLAGFNPDPARPVRLCQGVMLQALPGCNLEVFEQIRRRLGSEVCRNLLGREPDTDNYFERLARLLLNRPLGEKDLLAPAAEAPEFRCRCDRLKIIRAIRALPDQDEAELRASGELVRVKCEFCTKLYEIAPAEVWREKKSK